jgi:hypothetical protein
VKYVLIGLVLVVSYFVLSYIFVTPTRPTTTYLSTWRKPMATCRDGVYSYSQHRSGTCSGHGGVFRWYPKGI